MEQERKEGLLTEGERRLVSYGNSKKLIRTIKGGLIPSRTGASIRVIIEKPAHLSSLSQHISLRSSIQHE
jgi:hypothetical protein